MHWNESGVAVQASIRCTQTREILQFSITSTSGAGNQISTIDPEDCPELDPKDSFWIGMHDEHKNGDHKWASGKPLPLPYQWYEGKPAKTGEFCG